MEHRRRSALLAVVLAGLCFQGAACTHPSTSVPEVPAPPKLPTSNAPSTNVFDTLALNRLISPIAMAEAERQATNYRRHLHKFLKSLTPAQYEVIQRDDQQRAVLLRALFYLRTMNEIATQWAAARAQHDVSLAGLAAATPPRDQPFPHDFPACDVLATASRLC